MFNQLYENRQGFIKTLTENIEKVLLHKPSDKEVQTLDDKIEELKTELKKLIRFQADNGIDDEVYREEYKRVSDKLEELRGKRAEVDKDTISKENLKERVDEIIGAIKGRQEALQEFDENIFNALVEKIEILTPAHFVFELKSGVRINEFMINEKKGDKMGMEKRNCVGYIRINGNDDVIVNGQKNLIENFCKENGHQLNGVYIDCMNAISERLELNKLIEDSNDIEFDTVLIMDSTRLNRNKAEFKSLLKEFEANGVKVYSIAEGRFC